MPETKISLHLPGDVDFDGFDPFNYPLNGFGAATPPNTPVTDTPGVTVTDTTGSAVTTSPDV